jgi:hypothetical protein
MEPNGYGLKHIISKINRMALDILAEKPPISIYIFPLRFDDCEVPAIALPQFGIDLRDIQRVDC